jgi:EmrB/QacA subfamily drug resistance transporter
MNDNRIEARPAASPRGVAPNSGRWQVLALVAVVQLMLALDASVVNVALPRVQEALGVSDAARQWVVTAYALTFGGLLLLGGRIADFTGRKRVLLIGLVGFVAASALGGLATTESVLFVARGVQGAFAALMAPAGLSILSVTFTGAKERGTAFGVYGAVSGAGGAIGLVVGGLLVQYASWRWCLLINVPVGLAAALAGVVVLPESKVAGKARYDVPGAVTATLGLMSLVFGLTEGQEKGWSAALALGALLMAVVLLVAFVMIESRSTRPLVPLRIVIHRQRGGAFVTSMIVGAGLFGIFLFLSYYMQEVRGYTPVRTGLAFLPFALGIGVGAGIAGRMAARLGSRTLATAGLIIAAVGMLLFTGLNTTSGYLAHLLPGQLTAAIGCGLVLVTATNAALTDITEADSGAASALVNTAQQIGGALGIAALNAIAASAASSYLGDHPGAVPVAMVHAFHDVFLVGGIGLAAGAGIAALLSSRLKRQEDPLNARP